ncbi:response regulator [Streptomyces sp. NPDC056149]|uniref:response regulator n=1 Tax=unclassified Streptomyces TaxID=2593676 RepID=UPI0023811CBA|nr:response regulator transcription factor [Streptomyces sp. WZ-12]
MIRVIIVDDEPLVRHGLRTILEADPGIRVVAEAADGHAAIEQARAHACDVVLMDIRMPRGDGIVATRALRAMATPPAVVILTTFQLDEYVTEALRAGAAGFLLKDTPPTEIIRAVHDVAEGHGVLSPSVTRQVIDTLLQQHQALTARERAQLESLTAREREVLHLVGQGLSNADIARSLSASEATIKMHVSRVLAKLELNNRVQAALLARNADAASP